MKPARKLNLRIFLDRKLGLGHDVDIVDRHSRQATFIRLFSIVVIIVRAVYAVLYFIQGYPWHGLVNFMFVGVILANLLFLTHRPDKINQAKYIFIAGMMVLSMFSLAAGGLAGTRSLWVITVPIVVFFIEGWRRGLWWSAGLVAGLLVFKIIKSVGLVVSTYSQIEINQVIVSVVVVSVLVCLFDYTIDLYEGQLRINKHELEKFQQATENATDAILMTDFDGRIIYVNRAWQQLTGYDRRAALGQNHNILESGRTAPDIYRQMWIEVKSGHAFKTDEVINRRKDGTEYAAELHFFPIPASDHKFIFVEIQQDVTARKATDRAKSEFVSLASHQLQTPVAAISWFTELMTSGRVGPLNDQQRHFLSRINQSNHRMIGIVNSLLNTSRIDLGTFAVEPSPTELGTLVKEEVEECQAGHPLAPPIKVAIQPALPTIKVDPNLYRIIVQNLVTNAIRYTPVEGHIDVKLAQDDRDVIFSVADSGIGIATADQSKVFSKLFRSAAAAQREPNGTGLGLYVVKAIVDHGGGSISFTSQPGSGTTFIVRTPLSGMKSASGIRQLSHAL